MTGSIPTRPARGQPNCQTPPFTRLRRTRSRTRSRASRGSASPHGRGTSCRAAPAPPPQCPPGPGCPQRGRAGGSEGRRRPPPRSGLPAPEGPHRNARHPRRVLPARLPGLSPLEELLELLPPSPLHRLRQSRDLRSQVLGAIPGPDRWHAAGTGHTACCRRAKGVRIYRFDRRNYSLRTIKRKEHRAAILHLQRHSMSSSTSYVMVSSTSGEVQSATLA